MTPNSPQEALAGGQDTQGPNGPQRPERVRCNAHIVPCPVCSLLFTKRHPEQKYCCDSCRNRAFRLRNPRPSEMSGKRPPQSRERRAGQSIRCPKCGSAENAVEDTRGCDGYVWRKRSCWGCGHEFPTEEWPAGSPATERVG
jgi:hypothetical protein